MHWDDPRLLWPKEPPRKARYRALQSWYREIRLGVLQAVTPTAARLAACCRRTPKRYAAG